MEDSKNVLQNVGRHLLLLNIKRIKTNLFLRLKIISNNFDFNFNQKIKNFFLNVTGRGALCFRGVRGYSPP